MASSSGSKFRLLVVSNRLNVTVKKKDNGYEFKPSPGGLATALKGVNMPYIGIGWPGLNVPEEDHQKIRDGLKLDNEYIPVFIKDDIFNKYYNGFSNSVLWPIFHYYYSNTEPIQEYWEGYQTANELFADTVYDNLRDNDLVLVNDYHLMLLPGILRKKIGTTKKNVRIGFFLHTSFPCDDYLRLLPKKEKILEGILNSDLIGFHIDDYVRHFNDACKNILKLHSNDQMKSLKINYMERSVNVGAFPIGVDPQNIAERLKKTDIIKRIESLKKRFDNVTIIVGVDRLDYIKGLIHKLKAFELFLTENERYRGYVVLIQIAEPSREDVEEYKTHRAEINELVGRINGKFGTMEFVPIHFLYQRFELDELIPLYSVSDICLVSSIRDGMNLVSYEYVLCQEKRFGTLILSEFTGAAKLLKGAIIVNPWDHQQVVDAIKLGLQDVQVNKYGRFKQMYEYVTTNTASRWCENILAKLEHSGGDDHEPHIERPESQKFRV